MVKAVTRRFERHYRSSHLDSDFRLWRNQFALQRRTFQEEYATYWSSVIQNCPDSKSLWQKMNNLLHPVTSTSVPHSAQDFSTYFTRKVDNIRATTANAPQANITRREVPLLTGFHGVTIEEVSLLISKSSNKQCDLDPISTWLMKVLIDILAPTIREMVDASVSQSKFPDSHKHETVLPRIKKPSLDPHDIKSYRPMSNLSFVSKIIERLVANRVSDHARQHSLLPERQPAYRQ